MRRGDLRESSDNIEGKALHAFTWAVEKGDEQRSSFLGRIGWE
jgi:hypothetical protein